MQFDPENNIVKLCASGMLLEGEGKHEEAAQLFDEAWVKAITPTDKFIAAHYIARHQNTVPDKLKWDEVALAEAKKVTSEEVKGIYPSLYLNIAKCYEDMGQLEIAHQNYLSGQSFSEHLPNDGYGDMIRVGLSRGIERVEGLGLK